MADALSSDYPELTENSSGNEFADLIFAVFKEFEET